MFADDTVLSIRNQNLKKLEKIIATELLRITGWTRFNKLSLNCTKRYNMIRIIPNSKLKRKANNLKISSLYVEKIYLKLVEHTSYDYICKMI